MLTQEENELLTRVGPGTAMGRFMRRFWMPIMRSEDLPKGHAKPIRIMSEDFALYRGESGQASGYTSAASLQSRSAARSAGWRA